MPVLLLERLPLPSLEAYAVISASLLGLSFYYAAEKTLSPDWRMQLSSATNDSLSPPDFLQAAASQHWLGVRVQDILSFSFQDSLCIWVSNCKLNYNISVNIINLIQTDGCKHGILPARTLWQLAPEASVW